MASLFILIAAFSTAHAQKTWELYGKVNGMVGDEVISMDVSDNIVWVATTWADPNDPEAPLEGGVSLMDPSTGNFTTYRPNDGLAHKKVWTTLIDGDKVWFGTPKGLCMVDTSKLGEPGSLEAKEAWTTFTFDIGGGRVAEDIGSVAKGGDTVWFGSNLGLGAMNTKTEEYSTWGVEDGLPAKKVQAIAIDGKTVWIGTDGGLATYDTEDKQLQTVTLPDETTSSKIINVIRADDKSVWIGSREGLFVLDKESGKWTSYGEKELPDVWMQDIALSDEQVWVGTRKGIAILKRGKDKWKIMDEKKGLASNDVRGIRLSGDHIWIGTSKGLDRYYPGAAAAQFRQILLIVVILAAVVAGAVVAKVKFFKPSPEEIEKRKQAEEIRAKRKERKRTTKPPWELCGGVPEKDLCGRCKYNSVRSGKLHCSKYDIDLE